MCNHNITAAVSCGVSTGGGFSNFASRPAYQDEYVKHYLANKSAMVFAGGFGKYFNADGRAYPDVSVVAENYLIIVQNRTNTISGTSAAAPVFAGLITLINAHRQEKGRPPVGFANPFCTKFTR